MTTTGFDRDAACASLLEAARSISGDRGARMRAFADAYWSAFGLGSDPSVGGPASWAGFYEIAPEGNEHGAEPGDAMVLAAHRDKPACSPIGMQGACGRSFLEARSMVVRDVRSLGENYVACDPRDLSEVIVPLFEVGADGVGGCWGVFDVDSFELGAFDESDAALLRRALELAGLSAVRSDGTSFDERPVLVV
ncbi:MAG: hypothetical protein AAFR38_08345 [Planctomycetota bacterium]